MKRTIILCLLLIAFSASLHAQSFMKGNSALSLGLGLGSSIGNYSGSQTPAISLQYEKALWDVGGPGVISLGGYLGYKAFKYSGNSGSFKYSQKWNYTIIGLRSAYHYNGINADNLDVYGGLMLSYNILKYKYSDNSGSNSFNGGNYGSAAGLTLFVGGRYFFSDKVAAFAELGYGVSYLTLGLTFKLQ